jgi:hypothetical protein
MCHGVNLNPQTKSLRDAVSDMDDALDAYSHYRASAPCSDPAGFHDVVVYTFSD